MRFPGRWAVLASCLAAAAACGGGSGDPTKAPDPGTSGPATPPSGQGIPAPTTPSDPGTSGGPRTPPEPPPTSPPPPTTPPGPPPPPAEPPPPPPPPATYGVHIDCAPVNDFGYIGWAKGDLAIGGRTPDGALAVKGSLKLRYELFGNPEIDRDVQIEGTVEKSGQYVSAKVVSGADDLESVFFVFAANSPFSAIDGPNGSPAYQTQCGASTATIPHGSDLLPGGAMSFHEGGAGMVEVHVDVVNVGDEPTSGTSGRARIGSSIAAAELHRATDGSGSAPSALGPGEHGYLKVVLPQSAVGRCAQPQVVIDLDHALQSGAPDPFANDTAQVSTPCLTWSRPISSDALGFDPDPFLVGKTLGNIVGGSEVGRKDGYLCSHCHDSGSGNTYAPPVLADGSATIGPTDTIGGTTWAAQGGWAARFLTNPINKPDYLKAIVQRWLDDGARP